MPLGAVAAGPIGLRKGTGLVVMGGRAATITGIASANAMIEVQNTLREDMNLIHNSFLHAVDLNYLRHRLMG
jgi:hypothetical protein